MTSLKAQAIHGTSPNLHGWDKRDDKFEGSAQGDEHATVAEVDPIDDVTIGSALDKLVGHYIYNLVKPIVDGIGGVDLDMPVVEFMEQYGEHVNDELKKVNLHGMSLRLCLMNGVEE